jgi:hypothetical protein
MPIIGINLAFEGERIIMLKLVRWITKLTLGAVLVSAISIYTTWYAVNQYIGSFMQQFPVQVARPSLELSDLFGTLLPNETKTPAIHGQTQPAGGEGTVAPPKTVEPKKVPEDAVAVWGQVSTNQQSAGSLQQNVQSIQAQEMESVLLSEGDFQKIKEQISDEDKMKIFSLVMNRIPAEDLQSLSTFVENGLTGEELKQVEELVKRRLKSEEYEQILSIINKY